MAATSPVDPAIARTEAVEATPRSAPAARRTAVRRVNNNAINPAAVSVAAGRGVAAADRSNGEDAKSRTILCVVVASLLVVLWAATVYSQRRSGRYFDQL